MSVQHVIKQFFIPNEENQYAPRVFSLESTVLILSGILFLELLFFVQAFFVVPGSKFLSTILPGVVASLTNENRVENNLPPLRESQVLTQAARLKAVDMATRGYFSHTSPGGIEPWYWFDQAGYDFVYAGENLAVNFIDSGDVVSAWMNSEKHKENILGKNFTEVGIGVAKGTYQEREAVFVVQFFGTPSGRNPENVLADREERILAEVVPDVSDLSGTTGTFVAVRDIENERAFSGDVRGEQTDSGSRGPSFFERVFFTPRGTSTYVLVVLITLVALALALTVFVKIHIQHPRLIVHGALLLLVLGSFLVVNQYLALSGTEIF